jgi:AcrR family transcriptional regulator
MLRVMATRPYTTAQRRTTPESVNRVLDAAERLIREDWFHTATMDELAAAAGVSRATVFNRFGSKLGVLQALFTRAMEGPQMNAIREALEIEDPEAALESAIRASCAIWDREGYIHEHLQAIAILEPDARALIDEQKQDQRAGLQTLVRRLSKVRRLRPDLGEPRALATLHMLTSLETFHWLRRNYGLSLRQTRDTITALARTVLRD